MVADILGDLNATDIVIIVIAKGIERNVNWLAVVLDRDADGITVTTVHVMEDLLNPAFTMARMDFQDVLAEVIVGPFEDSVTVS